MTTVGHSFPRGRLSGGSLGLYYLIAISAQFDRRSSSDYPFIGGKGAELHKIVAAAVLFCTETPTKAALDAVETHCGYRYRLDYSVNRLFRDVKLSQIAAGTSEIGRLIITEALLTSSGRLT